MPGMTMSMSTTSGRRVATCSSASSPVAGLADDDDVGARSASSARTPSRRIVWSSTSRTRMAAPSRSAACRHSSLTSSSGIDDVDRVPRSRGLDVMRRRPVSSSARSLHGQQADAVAPLVVEDHVLRVEADDRCR